MNLYQCEEKAKEIAAIADEFASDKYPSQMARNAAMLQEIARLRKMADRLLAHCDDGECLTCGEIVCQHGDPMHFHHDGCPSCAMGCATRKED